MVLITESDTDAVTLSCGWSDKSCFSFLGKSQNKINIEGFFSRICLRKK